MQTLWHFLLSRMSESLLLQIPIIKINVVIILYVLIANFKVIKLKIATSCMDIHLDIIQRLRSTTLPLLLTPMKSMTTFNDIFQGFTHAQCQHLMYALSNHMISIDPNEETATSKHFSLSVHNDDHSYISIINSGATQHIFHDIDMFFNKRKVNNYIVTLCNKMGFHVHVVGDVRIDHLFT